jgi:hypothetical protein
MTQAAPTGLSRKGETVAVMTVGAVGAVGATRDWWGAAMAVKQRRRSERRVVDQMLILEATTVLVVVVAVAMMVAVAAAVVAAVAAVVAVVAVAVGTEVRLALPSPNLSVPSSSPLKGDPASRAIREMVLQEGGGSRGGGKEVLEGEGCDG